MNVFDVLREKLKEKSELYRREEEIQKTNPCYQIGVYGFKATGYEDAIEIVNQVEQEYNCGWIPCSERLPNKEEYLKDDGRVIVTDGNRVYQSIYDIYNDKCFKTLRLNCLIDVGYQSNFKVDKCVIAWQPLPVPYREEG